MQMPRFITKWRRQRAADRVVKVGRERARVLAQRRQIDGAFEHTRDDAAYLDARFEALSRERDRLIQFLKTTPAY